MSALDFDTSPENEEPACPWFESTVQLMDGELAASARTEALYHVNLCDICGPLVRGWSGAAEVIEDGLRDAAERAKPALFQVPGHVLQAIAPAPARVGFWERFRIRVPALAGLTAAIATAFVLLPSRPVNIAATPRVSSAPVTAALAPASQPGLVAVPPNDCHVHMLAFDGADGMVYRTETDGMTVIWVNEHEGA